MGITFEFLEAAHKLRLCNINKDRSFLFISPRSEPFTFHNKKNSNWFILKVFDNDKICFKVLFSTVLIGIERQKVFVITVIDLNKIFLFCENEFAFK